MSRLAIYNPAVKVLSNFTARSSGLTINDSLLMNQENVCDTSPDETLCCKQMPDCRYAVKAQKWMSPDTNIVCSFTSGWWQYEARPDLLLGDEQVPDTDRPHLRAEIGSHQRKRCSNWPSPGDAHAYILKDIGRGVLHVLQPATVAMKQVIQPRDLQLEPEGHFSKRLAT